MAKLIASLIRSFIEAVKAWSRPKGQRAFGVILLVLSEVFYALGKVPFIWSDAERHVQAGLIDSAAYHPEASGFSTNMLWIAGIIMLIFFIHGIFFYMKPHDLAVAMGAVFLVDLLIIGLTDLAWLVTQVTIYGSILEALGTGVVGFFEGGTFVIVGVFTPVIVAPLISLTVCAFFGFSLAVTIPIVAVSAIMSFVFGASRVNKGVEASRISMILMNILILIFIIWPAATYTDNVNGSIANPLVNQWLLEKQSEDKAEQYSYASIKIGNAIGMNESGFYNDLIKQEDNANVSNGGMVAVQYTDNGTYDLVTVVDKKLYYMSAPNVQGMEKSETKHFNSKLEASDIFIPFITKNRSVVIVCDDTIYFTYLNNRYDKTKSDWKKIYDSYDEKGLREYLFDILERQAVEGNEFTNEEFACIAYAQQSGLLINYTVEDGAWFGYRNGNELTVLQRYPDGTEELKLQDTAAFDGVGCGYFENGGFLYYVDNTGDRTVKTINLRAPGQRTPFTYVPSCDHEIININICGAQEENVWNLGVVTSERFYYITMADNEIYKAQMAEYSIDTEKLLGVVTFQGSLFAGLLYDDRGIRGVFSDFFTGKDRTDMQWFGIDYVNKAD